MLVAGIWQNKVTFFEIKVYQIGKGWVLCGTSLFYQCFLAMAMFGYILTIRQRKLKHFFNWFIPFPFYVVLFSIISEFDHFHKVGPLNECAEINSKNVLQVLYYTI